MILPRDANTTYMLFLDPRPDLDEAEVENTSASVSSTHETQLEVATPRAVKKVRYLLAMM